MQVDLQSIRSKKLTLAEYLMSSDFFDAEKFPIASFELTLPAELGDNRTTVEGRFSLHGSNAVLRFPLKIGLWHDEVKVTGSIRINRSLFGIEHDLPSEELRSSGDNGIADEFKIDLDLTFVPE